MPTKRAVRRRPVKSSSRVIKCTSVKQFRDAVEKSAKNNRLLYALFITNFNSTCSQMSMFVHDLSLRKEWLHVMFLEVNIQTVQDAVAELEVKGLPGVQCWKDSQCVQNTCYASPAQVLASLKAYAGDPPTRHSWLPGWLVATLQTASVGAVAAAGWWLYQTHGQKRPKLTGAAAELAQIEGDIRKTQLSIQLYRRQKGKRKEAKAALAKLKELESQKEVVAAKAASEERRKQRRQALAAGLQPAYDSEDDDVSDEEDAAEMPEEPELSKPASGVLAEVSNLGDLDEVDADIDSLQDEEL